MDISIIIGLLIALVIICATTVVNNLINKEYKNLKSRWEARATTLSDIVWYSARMDVCIDNLLDSELSDEVKDDLTCLKDQLYSILSKVKYYEQEKF